MHVGKKAVLITQTVAVKHREGDQIVQGLTAAEWQKQGFTLGGLASECGLWASFTPGTRPTAGRDTPAACS